MKTKHLLQLSMAWLIIAISVQSCNQSPAQTASTQQETEQPVESEIARGKYLVEIMGCNDCHSPKRMGAHGPEIITELMLSGYPADRPVVNFDSPMIKEGFAQFYPDLTAAAGPWGITFAGNLTPDATGIGNWSFKQFEKALTEGKFKGMDHTRSLLPPMPWQNYVGMKREDVSAIFAYLKSIPAVENVVPAPISPDKL